MTYKIKGTSTYLTMIEALSPARYYRIWLSDDLNGVWTPLAGADSWEAPFAGINNVSFADGVEPWTRDISHGELLRVNYDQTPTIDPETCGSFSKAAIRKVAEIIVCCPIGSDS